MPDRLPETCPHRQFDDRASAVQCVLLSQLMNGLPSEVGQVTPDICHACCRSFLPSNVDLNPVLASLIWSRAQIALNEPQIQFDPGLSARIGAVQRLAEESLPLVLIDEDDLPLAAVKHRTGDRLSANDVAKHLPISDETGKPIRNWAVGMTTASRRQPTLGESVASLRETGWESLHLFIDGVMELPEALMTLPRTIHDPAAGAWKNFYLAIVELLRRSDADGLMLVQDDALWPAHLPIREYLERIPWPEDGRFIVSPYCCSDYTADTSGWRRFEAEWHYGAVAFIFSRRAAEEFIADQRVIGYGLTQTAAVDSIVGEWAARTQIPVFVPTPSLVQHIGDISTLWKTSRAVGFRRASRYIGDEITPRTQENESR